MKRALEPRPSILDEVPDRGHVILEASAGTGKTYTLEHLVLRLLLEGTMEIDELLVVTFTEKATEELRSRLRARLLDLAGAGADELAAAGWRLDAEQRRRLEECLARVDELHVSTIHGFCQGLLHDLAFRHRRLFQQELVDGERLLREAFREVFRHTLGRDSDLGRATLEVLRSGVCVQSLEDLVTLAADFRGGDVTPRWEPRGLVSSLPALVGALRDPAWRSLPDGELAARCADRLEELADPGDPLELSRAWMEAEEASSSDTFRAALEKDGSAAARSLLASLEDLDARSGDPEALVASGFREAVLEEARERKASRGWYDFDDMLELVAEALRRPDGEVRQAVRQRFRCALIDEFQDTDPVQWEIFRRLFPPGDPEVRLVLIGDPKQSIYGFRSADLAVYQRARDEIRDQGGSLHVLTESFRSTPRMLAAHDLLFRDFFDPGIDFQPARAGRPGLALVGDAEEPAPVVVLRPYRAGRGRALSPTSFRRALQAEMVAEIRRLVDQAEAGLADGDSPPVPIRYRDVQVLARSNSEVREVAEALREAGLPYTLYRQEGLFQTDEAGHVLEVLRAVARPADRSARLRAWLTPFFAVPLARVPDARCAPADHPVWSLLQRWRQLAERGDLPSLFRSLLRDSGLTRRLLFSREGERELTDYEHVLEILTREALRGARTLPELVGLLADYRDRRSQPPGVEGNTQRVEGDRDAIQVLTMHKAKGLEAAVVFLYGGLWGQAPGPGKRSAYRIGDERRAHLGRARPSLARRIAEENRREDQRLLYVAVTRAKARLYLPWAGRKETTSRGSFGLSSEVQGSYRPLEERLTELLDTRDPPVEGLFHVRDVPFDPEAVEEPRDGVGSPWPALLDPDLLAAEPSPDTRAVATLRRARAGVVVTSYSRLARHGTEPWDLEEGIPLDVADEVDDPEDDLEPGDALPGGIASGLFLHEVLQRVDFAAVRAASDLASWRQDATAGELVARLARRHGLERRHLPRALELVWRALRTPLSCGSLRLEEGLCAARRRVAEMEFLFPIPEAEHPLLGRPPVGDDPLPFRVRRGYFQGVIDLFFEHDERVYFLDWKSDQRGEWTPEALRGHVERHYALQRQLYTLAVIRAAGLEGRDSYEHRFGGLLYCFLRGMERVGDQIRGVHFERPARDEVATWERELLARRYPGAAAGGP